MEECPTCGMDAENSMDPETWKLTKICSHCGSQKCSSCDMGDDVECPGCEMV